VDILGVVLNFFFSFLCDFDTCFTPYFSASTKTYKHCRFDAWKANEGMSKEDAMEKYAALVESLKQ
jgi:hypothetical protein